MAAPTIRSLRSPLGRVRGLGAAKGGTHHWWMQRVTSIALLPLFLWFVYACFALAGASYAETKAFVGSPVNAVLFLVLIGFLFHHMASGLQVVVEDYIHGAAEIALQVIIKFVFALAAIAALLAIGRIVFTA